MIFFDYILNKLRLGGGGGSGSIGGDGISIDILSFREQFTGDGIATTFQLTGAIENATYDTGVWAAGNIKNTYPADVVNQAGQPIYDGVVILVRNRINILSISAAGLVTLSNPPRSGVDFDVWYFYRIDAVDTFTDYRREDFVASMEADLGDLDAKIALKYDASNPNGYEIPSQLNTRDTNNRARANHTGTQLSSTISNFASSVLATVLTGLSLLTGTDITAADSILVALGKLQRQITDHRGNTTNPHAVTKTQVGLSNVPNTDATLRANHTGTQLASTISNFASTVLATVLTGISFATSIPIVAADTVLVALGKLQAQITTNIADFTKLKNSFYIEKITPGAPVTTTGALVEFFSSATGGVVARSIKPPVAATYRVRVSFLVGNSSAAGRVIVDLTIGGTSVFSVPYNKQPKTGADRHWVTMERRMALTTGAKNVDINITQTGPGTAGIFEANVEIEEILT